PEQEPPKSSCSSMGMMTLEYFRGWIHGVTSPSERFRGSLETVYVEEEFSGKVVSENIRAFIMALQR
ncbi:hypothetical protein A2U01_0087041, partial [Trifolium medium]|nr:hypothetical protein [Trifolium medium]